MKVYFGNQQYIPPEFKGKPCPFYLDSPMEIIRKELPNRDFWTNSLHVCGKVSADDLICCGKNGMVPLSRSDGYAQWKDEFDTSDLILMFMTEDGLCHRSGELV